MRCPPGGQAKRQSSGSCGERMTLPEVLGALDQAIAQAAVEERPGLVVALAARLAALGAGLVAAPFAAPEPAAEALDRNLSARETARRLGVSLPYLYKHSVEYPFVLHIGRRLLFSARGWEAWLRVKKTPDLTALT